MSRKPNILYVFADQWRRQAVGMMNEDPVRTPNMDRFAEESLVFAQAVSCTPLCSPHRSSLMTGKYALSTGVYTNCKTGLPVMLFPDEIGIGDVLKQGGYSTGYIGKWHLDLPEANLADNPRSGAKEWDAYTPPGPKRHGFDEWYSYGTHDEHLTPHYWKDSEEMIQVEEWSVKHETDMAIAFLDRHARADAPFSLFLSWNPPHSPFELVPEAYKALYRDEVLPKRENVAVQDPFLVHTGEHIAGGEEAWQRFSKDYFAAVTGIDEQFGRLLRRLEELGIADDTIVVLTSDHGELLGSHGMMAKHSWHEESIGVPFMIRWANGIPRGRTDVVLNTVDIMPTLLELAELPVPGTVQGQSVAGWMRGTRDQGGAANPIGAWDDRVAYISAFPGRLAAVEAFREAGLDHRDFGWRGIRSEHYTYVADRGYAPGSGITRWLYDLREDPYQLRPKMLNCSSEHAVAELLERALQRYLTLTNDGFQLD
jgi:arylsulfatase A-like enzyme